MRLPNHTLHTLRWRVSVSVWVYLCLSLVGSAAQASTATRQEAMSMVVSAMTPDSMPQAMDCVPCVRCYVAPVPVAQGVSGESKEAEAPHWQTHTIVQVETAWTIDTGVWHPRLPVRIEYSWWLN